MIRILIISIFFFNNVYAIETVCRFEEVYLNGQISNGFILMKDKNIRYEYFDKKLYGLILKDEDLYYFPNQDRSTVKKTSQNKNLIQQIALLFNNYPSIKSEYILDEYEIVVEKSNINNFISRLIIQSKKLSMSIYFYECNEIEISDVFFKTKPIVNYYIQ